MIEVSFRWEGLDELEAAFAALPAAVHQKVLDRALKKVAEPVAEFARRLAPRSVFPLMSRKRLKALMVSPHMADSIKVRSGGLTPDGVTVWVGPSRGHYWGWMNEIGTVKMAARPFLRPALDAYQAQIMQNLGAEIWKSLQQVSAGLARKATRSREEAYRSTFGGGA